MRRRIRLLRTQRILFMMLSKFFYSIWEELWVVWELVGLGDVSITVCDLGFVLMGVIEQAYDRSQVLG
jgi:hypothetical protein